MPHKPLLYLLTITIALGNICFPVAAEETFDAEFKKHAKTIRDSVALLKFGWRDRVAIEEIVDAHYQWESEILRETLDAELIEIGRSRSKAEQRTKKIAEHEKEQAALALEQEAIVDTLSQLADIKESAKKIEKHLQKLSDLVEAEVARLKIAEVQLQKILVDTALIRGNVQTAIKDIGSNAKSISGLGKKIDQLPRPAPSTP